MAFAGAVIAPAVVFVAPAARLYWLITGRRLPGPLRFIDARPYVACPPRRKPLSPDIRELFQRLDDRREPGPGDIPRWYDLWVRLGQLLYWQLPRGLEPRP